MVTTPKFLSAGSSRGFRSAVNFGDPCFFFTFSSPLLNLLIVLFFFLRTFCLRRRLHYITMNSAHVPTTRRCSFILCSSNRDCRLWSQIVVWSISTVNRIRGHQEASCIFRTCFVDPRRPEFDGFLWSQINTGKRTATRRKPPVCTWKIKRKERPNNDNTPYSWPEGYVSFPLGSVRKRMLVLDKQAGYTFYTLFSTSRRSICIAS